MPATSYPVGGIGQQAQPEGCPPDRGDDASDGEYDGTICHTMPPNAAGWWENHSEWQGSEGGSSSAGSRVDSGNVDKARAEVLEENTGCKGERSESGDGQQHKGPQPWERSCHQPTVTTQGGPWWYGKQSFLEKEPEAGHATWAQPEPGHFWPEDKACPFWPPMKGSVVKAGLKTAAKEEEGQDRTVPRAWGLMCGKNAPVASALRRCGWSVEAYDWRISKHHDLTSPKLQKRLWAERDNVDALVKAMDYSTLLRARDIPVPGCPDAPPLVRSHEWPMGLKGLSREDDARVGAANGLIEFMAHLADQVAEDGGAVVGENPENSWYWAILELMHKFEGTNWHDTLYAACAMGGARHMRQKIRHNVQELCRIRSRCCHVHDPDEWKPILIKNWCYPSDVEAEYTAELAWAIAVALSWWVARTGRVKLGVENLRMPEPREIGDRTRYLQWNDGMLRKGAMETVGYRCGIEPVGSWGLRCPKRVCIYDLEGWPENGLYIGTGIKTGPRWHGPAWSLARSDWATGYTPGRDGSPEECIRRFAEDLQNGNWHLVVDELEGKTLVCECKLGYPCHGEALMMLWVDEMRRHEKPSPRLK